MHRLLALLTGVLFACLICSRLFLKFCLGKMAECMEFQEYLQAGVHDSVREGTPAASWAKAKMRLTKSLRHLGIGVRNSSRHLPVPLDWEGKRMHSLRTSLGTR